MLVADANICIREVCAGDEAAIDDLIAGLDPESRFLRWFSAGVDIHEAADWAAHPARFSAVGLLAFAGEEPVGHATIIPLADGRGEVAFEVAAPWRHHGIAGALLERLIEIGTARGLQEIYADVLPRNADMLAVLREHSEHAESYRDGIVTVTIPVPPGPATPGVEEPVSRYLTHALGIGANTPTGIRMTSSGRIKVGRWLAFTAEQDFSGHAYEWRARAGSRHCKPVHVVDMYCDGAGSTDVQLFGRVPLGHADAGIMRWGKVGRKDFGYISFGCDVRAEHRFGSLMLPSELRSGGGTARPATSRSSDDHPRREADVLVAVEEPVIERVAHELGARRPAELLLDVGAMGLDRAHRQEELLADLGVRVTERDEPQHLGLAI